MRSWDKLAVSGFKALTLGICMMAVSVTGCGQSKPVAETPRGSDAPGKQANGSEVVSAPSSGDKERAPQEKDALHQSYAEATRNGDNPPADEKQPPDMTIANKPTFQLLKDLQKAWETIRFVDGDKKPIHYTAVVETSQGSFEIELKPELAPNHVRNFIALSRLGYYDSLLVDRIHHEVAQVADSPALKLDMIELGCPLGTGENPSGSIGYWLRPEFSESVKHEEGTVGFCRGGEPDSASTRIYITLDQAPLLDGNYSVIGKVKSGLDVVRKIARQPVIVEDSDLSGSHRPENQILIKKVTVKMDAGAKN